MIGFAFGVGILVGGALTLFGVWVCYRMFVRFGLIEEQGARTEQTTEAAGEEPMSHEKMEKVFRKGVEAAQRIVDRQ